MVLRVLDKIVFAVLFIIALQVPILADHYRQYLNGYYDALHDEVTDSSVLAKQHGFSSVNAMLDSLMTNEDAVVRDNATSKATRFAQITTLEESIRTLQHGHYFEKLVYMASPYQYVTLKRVLNNYSPSIPLTPSSIIFSFVTAILLNILLWTPHFCYRQLTKKTQIPKRYIIK